MVGGLVLKPKTAMNEKRLIQWVRLVRAQIRNRLDEATPFSGRVAELSAFDHIEILDKLPIRHSPPRYCAPATYENDSQSSDSTVHFFEANPANHERSAATCS
jgi:hypothetical protein